MRKRDEDPNLTDLVVSLSKNRSSVSPTESVTLMATVSNAWTNSISNTVLFWYRSADANLDKSSDTLLVSNTVTSLGAGASITLSNTITTASASSTNTYFAGVNAISNEINTDNNFSSTLLYAVPRSTYLPGLDFNTLHPAGNGTPVGIWSDGTTMWVSDIDDSKIYAYDLATKARNSSEDFDTLTDAGNNAPTSIWSDGSTMWVSDDGDAKLYAYKLSDKTRDSAKDFDTLSNAGNGTPYGHWSDGINMWVADNADRKIYAYSMSTKARNSSEDFSTGNSRSQGIWSDGITMWVANISLDAGGPKLLAYSLSNKTRNSSLNFDVGVNTDLATGNNNPYGIWSDGSTMWVVNVNVRLDDIQDKIFAFKK